MPDASVQLRWYCCYICVLTQGKSYENASSVPSVHRQRAFSSVMSELANVHRYHWVTGYDRRYIEHTSSDSFWQSQVGGTVVAFPITILC